MNKKMIIYTLGQMLKIEGFLMFLPLLVGLIYHEQEAIYYFIVGLITLVLGIVISSH